MCKRAVSFFIACILFMCNISISYVQAVSVSDYLTSIGKSVKECITCFSKVACLSWGIFYRNLDDIVQDVIEELGITADNISNYFDFSNDKITPTQNFCNTLWKKVLPIVADQNGQYIWYPMGGISSAKEQGCISQEFIYYADTFGDNAVFGTYYYTSSGYLYEESGVFPLEYSSGWFIAGSNYQNLQCVTGNAVNYKYVYNGIREYNSGNCKGNITDENLTYRQITKPTAIYSYYYRSPDYKYPFYCRKGIPAFVSLDAWKKYIQQFESGSLPVDYDENCDPNPVSVAPDTLFNTDWDHVADDIAERVKNDLDILVNTGTTINKTIYKNVINNYTDNFNQIIKNTNTSLTPDNFHDDWDSGSILDDILTELIAFRLEAVSVLSKLHDDLDFTNRNSVVNKSLNIVLQPIFDFQLWMQNFFTIDWNVIYSETTEEIVQVWNDVNVESNTYYATFQTFFQPVVSNSGDDSNGETIPGSPDGEQMKPVNNLKFTIPLAMFGNYIIDLTPYAGSLAFCRKLVSIILWATYGYSVISKIKPKITID